MKPSKAALETAEKILFALNCDITKSRRLPAIATLIDEGNKDLVKATKQMVEPYSDEEKKECWQVKEAAAALINHQPGKK